MGKDWLFWVGGGGGSAARRRRSMAVEAAEETPPAGGCMCAVFQLFDLHHFQLPLNHDPNHEELTSSKGVEAPRNSLELEPVPIKIVNSAVKEEENLNFSVGIQIKTKTSDFSSEFTINSPGTKTPNLVARLMGLDILPDSTPPSLTPSSSSTQSHFRRKQRRFLKNAFFEDDTSSGVRSLPETPRVSSSSSRKSDFDYHHHRLSLQVNNDNDYGVFDRKGLRFRHDYEKQIVKKRAGLSDITNRMKNEIVTRRDENLILLKPAKKISRFDENCSNLGSKNPKMSCDNSKNYHAKGIISKKSVKKLANQACDKAMIKNKKEAQFIGKKKEKKSKKTQLSSDNMSISGQIFLQVKKNPSRPTKLPQKQVSDALSSKTSTQLSSNPSPHRKIFTTAPDNTNGCATPTHGGATAVYGQYIQKILRRTGIIIEEKITPLTSIKWHTPSHPIDPSVFYYVELFHPSAAVHGAAAGRDSILSHRCNRKLIFQLVDELLAEILKPHFEFNPWASKITVNHQFPLFDRLCEKIDDFPAANCRVLEDIDLLIEKDFGKCRLNGFLEEEWGSLVCEIEGEIMENLVTETAAFWGGGRPYAGGITYRD